ncbi:MAG: malto-oligosyltrehalose synthase [Cytophaga sp.]|uniref:malto-oligosyltrehalose synthase n=1 Tax=Cytophaga sp. TaxID=29535 RepID=UPI003F810915
MYPLSTYRVQLNSTFTVKQLSSIIEYLDRLGITTVYASPVTAAVKGSAHGYDVTDPGRFNPEITTREELEQLSLKLKELGMTWLQDIVPNHMAFSGENRLLMDVLERGELSPYYTYFDINWNHPEAPGKVIVPMLGDEIHACIENKHIRLSFTELGFSVVLYEEQSYPVSISALSALLLKMHEHELPAKLIDKTEELIVAAKGKDLAGWTSTKKSISDTISAEGYLPSLTAFLQMLSDDIAFMMDFFQKQFYVFVSHKVSDAVMNYRRFFAINNLICLRIEDERVFDDYHRFLLELYRKDLVQGFRLDHIDGLYDPLTYIQRLREATHDTCYIIVEKILDGDEELPESWPIEGTTGYEFLAFVNRVLTDKEGADALLLFYKEFTDLHEIYETIVYEKKHSFLYKYMHGELDNLIALIEKLFLLKDGITAQSIKAPLGIFMASFPVYRIYPDHFPLQDIEMQLVQKAFDRSMLKAPQLKKEFDFIKELFDEEDVDIAGRKLSFIKRLMQFTGPLAAKGVEDTTFYVYNPLISHNEVGDAPSPLTFTVDDFHKKMIRRKQQTPFSLNATSTHDTKRGENARARINALSHLYQEWRSLVPLWHTMNGMYIQQVNGRSAPSLNDEYFIYQSLLGSFPDTCIADDKFIERTHNFLVKALREAKTETTYEAPDTKYEEACLAFTEAIIKPDSVFLTSFIPLLKKVIDCAALYAIAQIILKASAPGIPDFYQGSELNDLSYVDPDNRREIDYDYREDLLATIIDKQNAGADILGYLKSHRDRGAEQLFVTWKMLALRKKYPDVFLHGNYIPVKTDVNVLAYIRQQAENSVLVLIPLSIKSTQEVDVEFSSIAVELPQDISIQWKNIFTGETVIVRDGKIYSVFARFPVAVLESMPE